MSSRRLSDLTRIVVRLRDGGRCVYCGRRAALHAGHCDHVLPVVWGGSDRATNLVWSCADCNTLKGTCDLEAFAAMVFRHNLRRVTKRFASEAAMVAAVRQAMGQTVNLEVARAVQASEKA